MRKVGGHISLRKIRYFRELRTGETRTFLHKNQNFGMTDSLSGFMAGTSIFSVRSKGNFWTVTWEAVSKIRSIND